MVFIFILYFVVTLKRGNTALLEAAAHGNLEGVSTLLQYNSDVNKPNNVSVFCQSSLLCLGIILKSDDKYSMRKS